MSLGLSAPAAVPVEVTAGDLRVFRLSAEIGTGGLRLVKAAPFEPGRPVTVRFTLPGAPAPIELEGELVTTGDPSEDGEGGGAAVYFFGPSHEAAFALSSYISDRLGIPMLSSL